ncbi:MAG: DUF4097 family beta strand repeat-containing protein [Fusicatenibacter sp.]
MADIYCYGESIDSGRRKGTMTSTIYQLYMNELRKGLERYDPDFAAEILEDFEDHFAEGRSQGMSDEDICMELGPAEEVLLEIQQEFRDSTFTKDAPDTNLTQEKKESPVYVTASTLPIRRMEIRLQNTGVRFTPGSSDQVSYDFSGDYDQDRFEIYTNGDTFCLIEKKHPLFRKKRFWIPFVGGSESFLLQVPSSVTLISCTLVNGSCHAEDLHLDQFHVSTVNGGVTLRRIAADECFGSTTNSSLIMEEINACHLKAETVNSSLRTAAVCGKAELHSVNGSVNFRGSAEDSLLAGTVNGSVNLCYQIPEHGASLDASSTTGKILAVVNRMQYSNKKRFQMSYGDAALKIKVSTTNGHIELREGAYSSLFEASPNQQSSPEVQMGSGELPADQISSIEVNWPSGAVNIGTDDGSTIRFFESGADLSDENQMTYSMKSQKLCIHFSKSNQLVRLPGINSRKGHGKTLTLLIPSAMMHLLERLDVETVSAQTNIHNLSLSDKLKIENVSGKVCLDHVTAPKIKLENVSGILEGRNLNSENRLFAETVTGNISLYGSFRQIRFESVSGNLLASSDVCPEKVISDTASGNLTLILPGKPGFTYRMESAGGHVSCDFPFTGDSRQGTCGDGSSRFAFESISGCVSIKNHDTKD